MAIYRVQATIPRNTNLPEDAVVNTFHFVRNGTSEGPFIDAIVAALDAAYLAWRPVLANANNLMGTRFKFYDLADAEPRAPITDVAISGVTNPTGDPHPSEVAICVSFRAALASGVPAARRRGRIYLGVVDRATASSSDRDRIDQTQVDNVVAGANHLLGISGLGFDEGWAIYSRVDDAARLVVDGWVDNAFDTQRRRGKAPTIRTAFDGS